MVEENETLPSNPPEGTPPLPETGLEGAPPEAKAEITAPVSSPPPSPELEDLRRQLGERDTELQGYRTRDSQYEEWNKAKQVDAYAKQLLAVRPALDEETARELAQAKYDAWFWGERAKQAETSAKKQYQGQVLEAVELAKKYGGSVEELLTLSPGEMRTQARNMGEIATLKKQVAELTRKTVPAQTFESGAGGGGGGGSESLEALLKVDVSHMAPEELEKYNKKWSAALSKGR